MIGRHLAAVALAAGVLIAVTPAPAQAASSGQFHPVKVYPCNFVGPIPRGAVREQPRIFKHDFIGPIPKWPCGVRAKAPRPGPSVSYTWSKTATRRLAAGYASGSAAAIAAVSWEVCSKMPEGRTRGFCAAGATVTGAAMRSSIIEAAKNGRCLRVYPLGWRSVAC